MCVSTREREREMGFGLEERVVYVCGEEDCDSRFQLQHEERERERETKGADKVMIASVGGREGKNLKGGCGGLCFS